jgi:hypothetical protein
MDRGSYIIQDGPCILKTGPYVLAGPWIIKTGLYVHGWALDYTYWAQSRQHRLVSGTLALAALFLY